MRCLIESKETAEVLLAYCNRTLDADTAAALERHMEVCEPCRRLAESQKAVWAALDAWEATPISMDFDRRLYRRIDEQENQNWWKRFVAPLQPVSWKPALSLATACVTLLAVLLLRAPERSDVVLQGSVETVDVEQVERSLEDLEMLKVLSPSAKAEAANPTTL